MRPERPAAEPEGEAPRQQKKQARPPVRLGPLQKLDSAIHHATARRRSLASATAGWAGVRARAAGLARPYAIPGARLHAHWPGQSEGRAQGPWRRSASAPDPAILYRPRGKTSRRPASIRKTGQQTDCSIARVPALDPRLPWHGLWQSRAPPAVATQPGPGSPTAQSGTIRRHKHRIPLVRAREPVRLPRQIRLPYRQPSRQYSPHRHALAADAAFAGA